MGLPIPFMFFADTDDGRIGSNGESAHLGLLLHK